MCATSASATTTPPPTGSPVCSPASGHSSSTGVPGVDERLEALAHHHLAAGPVALDVLRAATGQHLVVQGAHLVDQRAHGGGVVRELVAGDREARPDGRAHGVVSHDGRRFSRNASIPSAASAPAKSSADVAAAAASPSAQLLRRAATAAAPWWPAPHRAPTCGARSVCAVDPGVERRPRRRRPRRAARRPRPRRAPKRSPVSAVRARKRRSITRSAGTRIMAGATPTRTSVKANVLASGARPPCRPRR